MDYQAVGPHVDPGDAKSAPKAPLPGARQYVLFGCQSEAGERFVERILTVAATCRRHGRSVFTQLAAAIGSARWGSPPPSLLPAAASPG